jgi:undecaprenyl-diphosphatase
MTFARRLLELDKRWSERLRIAERPGALRTAASLLAHSADSWFWLLGLGLVFILTRGPIHTLDGYVILLILATAMAVLAIKFTVRRRRPQGEWGAIYRNTDPHSFPSGHAARAFMLAVIALGVAPPWLGLLLVAWAALVCLARVAMGVHYLSDVLAGALLGIAIGLIALALLPKL